MKTLLLALGATTLVACASAPARTTGTGDNRPGGATSEAAVQRFFAAVHAGDLQAMSNVWGTSRGPARDNMERGELEKREVVLQCYFDFDTFRIANAMTAGDGRRVIRVELTRGGKTRTPAIYTVTGPDGRWYVENLDIAAVRDLCASAPAGPGGA